MEDEDFEEIRRTVRAFVRDRVVPLEQRIDAEDEIPEDIRVAAKEMGLYGFAIPAGYSGLGLGMHEECRLVFELGYTTPAFRSLFGSNNGIAGHVLVEGATEEQRRRWLPRLASGEVVASFALTEPDAGSDPSGLSTSARREGDGWSIEGSKRYITNAPVADAFMVFARTGGPGSGGISVFMVPARSAGLTVGPRDKKMGQAGAWTADVHLDAVHVGADALVGGEEGLGRGWSTAMRCLAHGRIHIAALCVGM
ncbi:MAG TPA: acyl-CoA dehydrogenase family protein, partial [Acidimicrobiales bacterium]|nr:acyl-CoA dehydrogenase family protein [Acidimicrobiales bacterium]